MAIKIPSERLDEVERRLLRAELPSDFERELSQKWGRTPRQIRKYVVIVRRRLAARAKSHDSDEDRELIRGMLFRAYRAAEQGGPHGSDAKGMVAAVKVLGEVTGVIGPRKVEITGKDGGPVAMAAHVVMLPMLDAPTGSTPDGAAGSVAAEPGTTD